MLSKLFTIVSIISGLCIIVIFDLLLIIPFTKDQPIALSIALLCEIVFILIIIGYSFQYGYKKR
jgi:uncharacterized membrane protein